MGTPYEGGVFHCALKVGEEFPQKPPKGYFTTKIFHPNVSPEGEICVNILKKDWEPTNWSLRNIFEVIRCLLIVPFPESSLNEEAGKLFMENYEEYAKTARVYCSVYARKKLQSPVGASSENQGSPTKATAADSTKTPVQTKQEGVLGALTLNPHSAAGSTASTGAKLAAKTHGGEKKKWMKRI